MTNISPKSVISFTKSGLPYGFLGNMYSSQIEYDGLTWRTAEALFQALRFDDPEIRELIRQNKSPMGAKFCAKANEKKMCIVPLDLKDIENMRMTIQLKFDQHADLRQQLLSTGNAILIEDVSSRKRGNALFWGAYLSADTWIGTNKLGELLMELRAAK